MVPLAPFDLPLDEYLAGPGVDEGIDIDRIFSVPFARLMAENAPHANGALDYDEHSPRTTSQALPGAVFVEVDAGVLLLDPNGTPIGCYIWTALAVDDTWQGRGVGKELVIERLLREGENPVWALDTPAYSPAGQAAHVSAWQFAQAQPAEIYARRKRIELSHSHPAT